jgi:isoquinoline 1-oxidoreductase subunit alpha
MQLSINGTTQEVDVDADMPLLWVLRDELGLTGSKYACGIQQCGACKVHIDGEAIPSCGLAAGDAIGKDIITIEGLGAGGLHAVQKAWIEDAVAQCGYCQSGQVMATAAFLAKNPNPTEDDVRTALARNLCRCGTYPRIVTAVLKAAEMMGS